MYPRNLPLKIGRNRVINRVDLVVVIVAVDLFVVVVDSKNLPLKFGKNRLSNSWCITDIEFLVGGSGRVIVGGLVLDQSHFYAKLNFLVELSWSWVVTKNLRDVQ